MARFVGHRSSGEDEQDGYDAMLRYVNCLSFRACHKTFMYHQFMFTASPCLALKVRSYQKLPLTHVSFSSYTPWLLPAVGEDKFKNRYFEDRAETYGRDRWVEYVDDRNPDSLKITPEWHAWLHHNTDAPPADQPLPKPTYQIDETGNPTGTSDAYFQPTHRLSKQFHGGADEKYESWTPNAPNASKEKEGGGISQDVYDLK